MKKTCLLFSCTLVTSCALPLVNSTSNQKTTVNEWQPNPIPIEKTNPTSESNASLVIDQILSFKILDTAKKFIGTPYQYGGQSLSGIDCSGLIVESFKPVGIKMPRMSKDQANFGQSLHLDQVEPADLLFFNTNGKGVSHVGIVEKVDKKDIYFIHASSSRNVMISSLNNPYWKKRFVSASRVLSSVH